MPTTALTNDANACYSAMCAHDARFDGRFFTAVTSTRIYCRPVCRVRLPKRENCLFFEHAAQAEQAGFRPCLRCRPELAPLDRHWSTEDAGAILFRQAAHWLDNPEVWHVEGDARPAVARLATRLGISDRHLRRIFDCQLGLSPLQYLLTRKLLTAKQLLADTSLPITQIAHASGFGSQRRFNAAFNQHYGLNPGQLRRPPETPRAPAGHSTRPINLGWRPPFDAPAMLRFFFQRQIAGVESVDPGAALTYRRTLRLVLNGQSHQGWISIRLDEAQHQAQLTASDSLQAALPSAIWRVRGLFDLDAEPATINASLSRSFPSGDGLRVPGCVDGFELAVRAILGQQITVAAARTLTQRLTEHFGEPIDTPWPGLSRLFPTAHAIAQAPADALGALGIVRQRQKALQTLACAMDQGQLDLSHHADPAAVLQALQRLPGIGPWTAQYIAMRALRWPDAWPVGDVALTKALGLVDHRSRAAQREAERLSQAWRPWRSYAVVRAWAAESHTRSTPHPALEITP